MKTKTTIVEKIPVKALYVPMRCPVCNGYGTLKYGTISCHGCDKKGFILIPAEPIKEGEKR